MGGIGWFADGSGNQSMIRRAREFDTDAVLPLLEAAHQAKGLDRLFAFDPVLMERRWRAHLASPDSLCLVYDFGARVRGVFVGMASAYPYGAITGAIEVISFIEPDYRGGAWFKMCRVFEDWARAKGCRFAAQTGKDDPRFAKALDRRGYLPFETHYLKEL